MPLTSSWESTAYLQSKVGFMIGSFAVLSLFFAFFCVPDCHGKSLEEIDKLSHEEVETREFKRAKISVLEEDKQGDELVVMEGKRDLEWTSGICKCGNIESNVTS